MRLDPRFIYILQRGLLILVVLVLFGVVESQFLMISAVIFVCWRAVFLVEEYSGKYSDTIAPRSGFELLVETAGLIALAIMLPLSYGLLTEPFFSVGLPWGWLALIVILLGWFFYFLPHLLWQNQSQLRITWWALTFALLTVASAYLIETRHPYLKPWEPDRLAIATERVLNLDSIVLAGRHANWVLAYAESLDAMDEREAAAQYYEHALRLNAGLDSARERLVEWGYLEDFNASARASSDNRASRAATPIERVTINSDLERVREMTVVLVPVGEVGSEVLESIADAIRLQLDLPVKIADVSIDLPSHDRRRGLAVGRQWRFSTIAGSFVESISEWPAAPIKYIVVTPVDIYGPNTNFVFSVSFDWGAVLSLDRFGNPDKPDPLLKERAAKQSLSALIKSFPIPPSTSRQCVTSYTRSLAEFDAKGDAPAADTMEHFHQQVSLINRDWQGPGPILNRQ
jgi:predicted Zn-dependent protease